MPSTRASSDQNRNFDFTVPRIKKTSENLADYFRECYPYLYNKKMAPAGSNNILRTDAVLIKPLVFRFNNKI